MAEEQPVEKGTTKQVVTKWSEEISTHGLPKVFERWKLWKRLLWLVVFLVCMGVMSSQIAALIRDFQKYETTWSFNADSKSSLTFPDVTLCNVNPYKESLKNETGIDYPKNDEEVIEISQTLDEFIIELKFNSYDIPRENLSQYWTQSVTPFGSCWTFQTPENVTQPNHFGGLEVMVNIDQLDYETTTPYAGVFVFITDQNKVITYGTPNIFAKPGNYQFMALRKVTRQGQTDGPWKTCQSDDPMYSQELCRAECFDSIVIEKCNCIPLGSSLRTSANQSAENPLFYCSEEELNSCSVEEELNECKCDQMPCKIVQFISSVSYLTFPAAKATNSVVQFFDFDMDVPIIFVNYQSLLVEEWTEQKSTTRAELVSNLGGQLGLFGGISFISIFEIFGDLLFFRLIPRLFGFRGVRGIGAIEKGD